MLYSLTDLLSWRASTGETTASLTDLLFDPETRHLTYLALYRAGEGGSSSLVAASRLAPLEPQDRRLHLSITEDELSRAPHWSGGAAELDALLTALPPLVIGPFGATHAPLAMSGFFGREDAPENDPRAEAALARYQRLGRWLDRPVFCSDAEVGTLVDLLYDAEAGRIDYLVVDNGKLFGNRKYALPFSSLAHRAPGAKGGHLVLDLAEHDLTGAPEPSDLLQPEQT